MNSSTLSKDFALTAIPATLPTPAKRALALARRLKHGTLSVVMPGSQTLRFGNGAAPHASLVLANWNVCAAALKSGDIGFAETYIARDWSTPNLVDLLQLFIANRREVEDVIYGHWAGRLWYRLRHLLRRNSRSGSKKNIHAHYDLGNRFYQLWLDDTMNYSSAWFEAGPQQSLREAQLAKVRRALRMSGIAAGGRLLEIGCGWGALAQVAAQEFGAQVCGLTLSHEQLAYGQQRLAAAGLAQHAQLRLQDYRDLPQESFDALCSIEMVEAVGQAYWPQYFQTVARVLKPGARACIQSIVIDDALFERYVSSTDFIQQYIFPGGCLLSPSVFKAQAQAAGLRVVDEFAFGADYAETLKRWREQFLAQKESVLSLNFDEGFVRTWEFYLAYCEAAFAQRNTNVIQYTLQKM